MVAFRRVRTCEKNMTMKMILDQLTEAGLWFRDLAQRFSLRRDMAPIATVARVEEFAATRSALITQKKLYGYLKERMGVNYPKVFTDEVYAQSMNLAKLEIFAASLADLTCFCVANAATDPLFQNQDRDAVARACYRHGLAFNAGEASDEQRGRWIEAFEARLGKTVWSLRGEGGQHFIESPGALIRWAPIAEELKRLDREIVENSIRYAWIEVRTDYMARIRPDAVAADWRMRAG
jgi:hypothetical protein